MVNLKKILFVYGLLNMYVITCDQVLNINLSPHLFQGKYKISQNIQNFIENFKPIADKKKIVELLNNAIHSFATKDQKDFFIHILNTTMVTSMKTLDEVQEYLSRVVDMVTIEHKLPEHKKSMMDTLTGFFKEKSIDELFDEALSGNKNALKEIKTKSLSLKDLSLDQKHEILKKLENKALDMLKKVDEKMPEMHQLLEEKYDSMREDVEIQFEKASQDLDHTSEAYKTAQKAYYKNLDTIMDKQKKDITRMRTVQDSQNYLVLKNCHDIVYALEPMLSTQHQHMMFTYDRTNNSPLLNILNFKDFDLSNVKTTEELDAMIQKEVEALAKDKKIDLPVHRETKSDFHALVKNEILEHHPDLALPAQRTGQNMTIADKDGDLEYKNEILMNHHKLINTKPYWQREQIDRNLNTYLLEHEKLPQHIDHVNRENHSVIVR